jgi:hypothetical protein
VVALLAATALGVVATSASAGGDYGPDTCLDGFVWREATSVDHACVTPDVRTQTAQDNSEGATRRSPTGGTYGPETCLQGFVWREAVVGDHVCVVPAARDQARDDNLKAATRRNDVRTALRSYVPEQPSCDGSVCTRTSDDAPRYRLVADRINVGQALVVLVRIGGRTTSWRVPVPAHPTAPGGWLSFRTGQLQCGGGNPNAYFRVQDGSSGRWSARQYVRLGCVTF